MIFFSRIAAALEEAVVFLVKVTDLSHLRAKQRRKTNTNLTQSTDLRWSRSRLLVDHQANQSHIKLQYQCGV